MLSTHRQPNQETELVCIEALKFVSSHWNLIQSLLFKNWCNVHSSICFIWGPRLSCSAAMQTVLLTQQGKTVHRKETIVGKKNK